MHPLRDHRLSAVAVCAALLGSAACGGDDGGSAAPAATEQGSASAGSAGGSGASSAGPRTVEHIYGTTVLPESIERVVVTGFTDIDVVLALGVVPVGYNDWYGVGLQPWAAAQLPAGAAEPVAFEMTDDGMPVEEILALQPDLVLDGGAMSPDVYEALSGVVPTVAVPVQSASAWVLPWDAHVEWFGEVLGLEDRAAELVADLDARYAAVRSEHPEFAEATAAIVWPGGGKFGTYVSTDDSRMQILADLGFRPPASLVGMATEDPSSWFVELSPEQVSLLESDVLVGMSYAPDERATADGNSAFQNLDVVERGDLLWLDTAVMDAFSYGSILSTPFVIDELVPQLATLVGD